MEQKHWKIKYSTKKYEKAMTFFGSYIVAMEYYNKIKWPKALWDITTGAELIHDSFGNGHGGHLTSTFELVNKA